MLTTVVRVLIAGFLAMSGLVLATAAPAFAASSTMPFVGLWASSKTPTAAFSRSTTPRKSRTMPGLRLRPAFTLTMPRSIFTPSGVLKKSCPSMPVSPPFLPVLLSPTPPNACAPISPTIQN